MFTAGNDIGDFTAVATGAVPTRSIGASPFLLALAHLTKPLIAAVQGNAVGVGTTMLLHCDMVFIAEGAKLTTPFVNLALVPEAASTWLLPARIGYARAYAMFALGQPIDGKTAAQIGIATAAVPASEVQKRALEAARALAAKPAGALARDEKTHARRRDDQSGDAARRRRVSGAPEKPGSDGSLPRLRRAPPARLQQGGVKHHPSPCRKSDRRAAKLAQAA